MALRLRTSTSRRAGKIYRYYQLVRAVRKNGKPTHEVVAHLGRLPQREVDALQKGLLSLKSESVDTIDNEQLLVKLKDVIGRGALRYLDVMVVCCLWWEWGLGEFFNEYLPKGNNEVAPADVVLALVCNRCLAPCSKLRVTEWVPRTALPEIIGFNPEQLHNTRIHRVLEALKGIEPALTRFLVAHPKRRQRVDSVVYLDLTNTWFEGHGGTLGRRARTKDGAIRRHVIQLALGVDARGLPIMWQVLPGNTAEVKVLPGWVEWLDTHEELDELPLVFDRGLTSEANLCELLSAGRKFVTCARESQVENRSLDIDLVAIANTPAGDLPSNKRLLKAGLCETKDEDIYYVDCGVLAPLNMASTTVMRVVPYFRPSLFHRNRDSLYRLRRNVFGKVETLNQELRAAKRDRSEEKTRAKIDKLLATFDLACEFNPRLEPYWVQGKTKRIRSFQIYLDPVGKISPRELNAGWMVLLAHPEDDRSALELIRQYHQKEIVEHAFAVIKSFVDLRPIQHQTTQKIEAHVTLCVLALLLDRYLELKLRSTGITDAIDRVYEALEPCRLQVLSDRRRSTSEFKVTDATSEQLRLLRALRLSRLVDEDATHRLHRCRY